MRYGEVSLKGDAHATGLHPRGHADGQPGPSPSANPASAGGSARCAAGKQDGIRGARGDAM